MAAAMLTARQQRERQFYEEFARRTGSTDVCFDPVLSLEGRPWNSYWYVMQLAKEQLGEPGQKLLDYGCGPGEHSLLYCKMGYEVTGFDLSPGNIALARQRAQRYGMADKASFSIAAAEALPYPSGYFDALVGIDILHHVDVASAAAECARVLKPGGVAIFHEPVRAPVFDALRESKFGLWLAPKSASLDEHLTEDERKLSPAEIKTIKKIGRNAGGRSFRLTTRVGRLVRLISRSNDGRPAFLERVDQKLFRLLPFFNRYAGIVVVALKKPA